MLFFDFFFNPQEMLQNIFVDITILKKGKNKNKYNIVLNNNIRWISYIINCFRKYTGEWNIMLWL